jgi:glycosyltransferase involved in cell wall biosynthesis
MREHEERLAVVIPTRNRPDRLERCLDHLSRARSVMPCPVYVVDSSTSQATREAVASVCVRHDFVILHHHDGEGVAAARNECVRVVEADLIVNVDDDVYLEPEGLERLAACYEAAAGWRVAAGTVAWYDSWSRPRVTRLIGYGRPALPGEAPHFVIGAFFLYPRALGQACPWIESIPTADDRTIGSLWRRNRVQMLFEPQARAHHDERHHYYGVEALRDHFYAALFDALIANRSLLRAVCVEGFGLPAGVKRFVRGPRSAAALIRSWAGAHLLLRRDWRYLNRRASEPLPPPPESVDLPAPMDVLP